MLVTLIVVGALLLLFILVNLKTSRCDGVKLKRVHQYRRLMPYIMRTRNESVVYFDSAVHAEELLKYLAEAKQRFDVDLTHSVVAACYIGFTETPTMNQFVSGRWLYQRKGHQICFSIKRKQMDKKAKLSIVKLDMDPEESFQRFCERVGEQINVERSGKRTHADKEFDLFTMVPRPVMNWAVSLFRWLDYHNILPWSFIKHDGMYCSLFVANLGSVQMGAGFHHLYEWGNCPLFLMVGQIEERAVVVDGQVVVRKILPLRYTYDERIDDGLSARFGIDAVKRSLERPYEYLGCLKEDGSDARPFGKDRVVEEA